jgi:hypothetical protein
LRCIGIEHLFCSTLRSCQPPANRPDVSHELPLGQAQGVADGKPSVPGGLRVSVLSQWQCSTTNYKEAVLCGSSTSLQHVKHTGSHRHREHPPRPPPQA